MKRSICAECGAWGPVKEYHPFAYCVLVKAIGEKAARANIGDVVEYGRKLERSHLQASGRAVVPVEPNNTVVTAGCFALDGPAAREALMAAMLSGDRHAVGQTKMRLRWAAMLAAANDGKAVVQEASAERSVAHSPNIKAPYREGEQDG